MEKAVEMNVFGIKCDNPECDYQDMTVKYEDYSRLLNKPCPKCGDNLLTQEDLERTETLIHNINMVNKICEKHGLMVNVLPNEPRVVVPVEMDRSGNMKLGEIRVENHSSDE